MTKAEVYWSLNENTRAFLLMARHGRANLFRDLNRRYSLLLKELALHRANKLIYLPYRNMEANKK